MVKIQKISRLEPTLGFTEFDIYQCYKSSFESSESGRLHALFPFKLFCQSTGLVSSRMGCPSLFSPEGKVALMLLKSYTGFSDADLVSHLNGNIHFQLFCGVYIHPSRPLTNHKIESVDKHYIRPIVRGKETRNVKFGAKVNNIQMDGISFIEHLSFNASNEGTRLQQCIELQQRLFKTRVKAVAADAIHVTNANRKYCTRRRIHTSFVRKGRVAADEDQRKQLRSALSRERATRLEGSFGTRKQHYSLDKIKARIKENEILWIFFGIHTANAVKMIEKV